MGLFGGTIGRSTGTRFAAFSYFSGNTRVSISPLLPPFANVDTGTGARVAPPVGVPDAGAAGRVLPTTALPCSLASASGTTRVTPSTSTIAKPCRRNAPVSMPSACPLSTGRSDTSVSLPLTRGSTRKLRCVHSGRARYTAGISVSP
ncbi:hypothetical protein G6F31_020624 [Rhizopus arrhizus]|nr:hypothetical protein G6F31_020624 [Rhizopus arrhizus]